MSFSDPLGDMLTRIRNGQKAKKSSITSPSSRLRANVLEVLTQEGYIRGYSKEKISEGIEQLIIELKYYEESISNTRPKSRFIGAERTAYLWQGNP